MEDFKELSMDPVCVDTTPTPSTAYSDTLEHVARSNYRNELRALIRQMKLATCLLNISEARNKDVIYGVINAATNIIEATAPIGATVLNAFIDPEYNRSVITIRNKHKATINK